MDFVKMKPKTLFLRYVIPQMIGLVFNSVYFIVDGVFIGRLLGTTALAAAGVAVPIVEMTIAMAMMMAVGAGVLISAAAGRGEMQKSRDIFNLAVGCTLGVSVLLAVMGGIFAGPLAAALGASDVLLADTTTYLRIYLLFSPFLMFSYALSSWVRNDGAPNLAMWALLFGAASNIVLDWVLMVPFKMGIAGAALATGLGPVFSVCILLPHFLRKKGRLWFQRPRWIGKRAVHIFACGLPAFVAEFGIGFVTLLYNKAIMGRGLGEGGLAAYMVIGYAALICLTAFLGAGQGLQPAVSYLHGKGEHGQILALFKMATGFLVVVSILLYGLVFLFGKVFFGVFIADAPAVLEYAVASARIYFIHLPFAALNILLISFMQAMGCNRDALVLSLGRSTVPVMAFLWILPILLGDTGLWLVITVAELFNLILGKVLWRKQTGKFGLSASRAKSVGP